MDLAIQLLASGDVPEIAAAFAAIGWHKPAEQYYGYLVQQRDGRRTVLVARVGGVFVGYVTIDWEAEYPPFVAAQIPEIQDFNVLPQFQRQGIGTRLLDRAEALVAERSPVVGIGVGLYADYGAAQRLYPQRGYVPDGRGIVYNMRVVQPGESVLVDDSLALMFTKRLRPDQPGTIPT